ncbi:MAG: ThiF family adenylyltransferase [Spirochaetaceae bacterium]|nr:ThiF family adenylyltransferase [Spirochaetaceae bacterium]
MSPKDRLSAFGEQAGFTVRVDSDVVRAMGVPCLLAGGIVGTCTIEKSHDPESGKPTRRVGGALHAVRIITDQELDGRVYHADGSPIQNCIDGDEKTWSTISIRKGSQGSPEKDESATDLIHRYAKQVVGAVSASGYSETASLQVPNPFKIPNTFEARAAIGPVQDRIRDQRTAIIGLGGTGAYVLDLIAKTPVMEIHLLDSDDMNWHNFMRAPGAPTAEEIELRHKARLRKVDYYYSKYASLREGIHPHPVRVDNPATFSEFLSVHPIDYAFVCIDQLDDGDSPRQDVVYCALSEAAIPFIDSGVSIDPK